MPRSDYIHPIISAAVSLTRRQRAIAMRVPSQRRLGFRGRRSIALEKRPRARVNRRKQMVNRAATLSSENWDFAYRQIRINFIDYPHRFREIGDGLEAAADAFVPNSRLSVGSTRPANLANGATTLQKSRLKRRDNQSGPLMSRLKRAEPSDEIHLRNLRIGAT